MSNKSYLYEYNGLGFSTKVDENSIIINLGFQHTVIPLDQVASLDKSPYFLVNQVTIFTNSGKKYDVTVKPNQFIEAVEKAKQMRRQPTQSNDSGMDQLEKLAELKDKGVITEEEFQRKKQQLLGL